MVSAPRCLVPTVVSAGESSLSTETDALFDDQMPTGPAPLASEKRGTSWPKIVALLILIAGLVWFRFLRSIKPKSTTSIDNASVTEIDFGNHDQLEARFNNNARAQFNVATTELTVSETGDGQVMSDFAVDAGTFLEQRMIRPSARADLVTSLRLYQTNPPKNLWQHITKDDRRPAFALSRDRSYFVAPIAAPMRSSMRRPAWWKPRDKSHRRTRCPPRFSMTRKHTSPFIACTVLITRSFMFGT